MGKTVDAAIGRIEVAERLDKPGHMLGRAIPRTGQVVGRPGKGLANALHGRPYDRVAWIYSLLTRRIFSKFRDVPSKQAKCR